LFTRKLHEQLWFQSSNLFFPTRKTSTQHLVCRATDLIFAGAEFAEDLKWSIVTNGASSIHFQVLFVFNVMSSRVWYTIPSQYSSVPLACSHWVVGVKRCRCAFRFGRCFTAALLLLYCCLPGLSADKRLRPLHVTRKLCWTCGVFSLNPSCWELIFLPKLGLGRFYLEMKRLCK
jgi:hypothetical protein